MRCRSRPSTTRFRLRTRLLAAFEHAGSEVAAGRPRPDLSIVVVGGGPTASRSRVACANSSTACLGRTSRNSTWTGSRYARGGCTPRARTVPSEIVGESGADARPPRRACDHRYRCRSRRGRRVVLADGRRLPSAVTIWAAGVVGSPVAALLGVPLGAGDRIPVRLTCRSGPPRGVRDRRHRGRAHRRRAPAAAGRATGDPGRPPRRRPDRGADRGPPDRAVPLSRQGFDGDDRPQPGGHRVPERAAFSRPHRLADVARPAPRVPDRLPQ